MSFLTRKWTDAEKWSMGIAATLLIAAIFGTWQSIFSLDVAPMAAPLEEPAINCSNDQDIEVSGSDVVIVGPCSKTGTINTGAAEN